MTELAGLGGGDPGHRHPGIVHAGVPLTHVDDAPVVDVLAIAWRYAVMMTRLHQDCGIGTSRAGAFVRRDTELVQLMAR